MRCPVCQSRTIVKDVRGLKYRKQFRKRECSECKYRFTSYEITQLTLLDIFEDYLPEENVSRIAKVLEIEFPEIYVKGRK